jgi:hypothetical protein
MGKRRQRSVDVIDLFDDDLGKLAFDCVDKSV